MSGDRVICRRCLLDDMDEDDYVRAAKACIERIPADKRAGEEIYKNRLEICRQCDHLFDGTCRKCGCFAELRALKPEEHCPDTPARW